MQEITYVVHIEDGIFMDDILLDKLDHTIEDITGCKIIKSRIEDMTTIIENGEWEDEEDE